MNAKPSDHQTAWASNPHLTMSALTPLEERCAKEKPQLLQGLEKLKALIGSETFDRCISPLPNLNQSGKTVLLVAGNEMRRSHILRECVPSIKIAFGAETVHVIGGGGFAGIGKR